MLKKKKAVEAVKLITVNKTVQSLFFPISSFLFILLHSYNLSNYVLEFLLYTLSFPSFLVILLRSKILFSFSRFHFFFFYLFVLKKIHILKSGNLSNFSITTLSVYLITRSKFALLMGWAAYTVYT